MQGRISCSTRVAAPPERCFEAFGSAAGWDAWFTTGMSLVPEAGGAMVFRWRDFGAERYSGEEPGRVLRYEPPGLLEFDWQLDRVGTRVTLRFEAVSDDLGEGTLISLEDVGYDRDPDGEQRMVYCATGWGEALTLAKAWIEHGIRLG